MILLITNILINKTDILKNDIEFFIPSIDKQQLDYVFEYLLLNEDIIIVDDKIRSTFFSCYDKYDLVIPHKEFSNAINVLKTVKTNSLLLKPIKEKEKECEIVETILLCNENFNNYLTTYSESNYIINDSDIYIINDYCYYLLKNILKEITVKEYVRYLKINKLL